MVSLGKWVLLVHPQAAEGMVHKGVAGFICPHGKEQLPHAGVLAQPPVHLGNVGGLRGRKEKSCDLCLGLMVWGHVMSRGHLCSHQHGSAMIRSLQHS